MSDKNKWVDIFGNAPSMTEWKPEQYAKNITLIYPVTIPFDGTELKMKFSNKYGNEKVKISSFSVFHNGEIAFLSRKGIEMNPGEECETESFSCSLKMNEKIEIRFYLGDFTNMTSGVLTTGKFSGGLCVEGDYTEILLTAPEKTVSTKWNYFLTDVYLKTSTDNRAIICFGDSITAQDWPDYLYDYCLSKEHNNTAIVRKAVSGTRLLRQYECNKYRSYGIKGEIRFPHEIEAEGADTVIIQHGINDIIHPVGVDVNEFRPMSDLPSAEEMTDMLKLYIETAKKKGLKVYLGTLLPIEGWRTYADFREQLREAVNQWIRSNSEVDGIIDFDKAVCSQQNSKAFGEGFDSGDHLHPSLKAYKTMAECAYNKLFNE